MAGEVTKLPPESGGESRYTSGCQGHQHHIRVLPDDLKKNRSTPVTKETDVQIYDGGGLEVNPIKV